MRVDHVPACPEPKSLGAMFDNGTHPTSDTALWLSWPYQVIHAQSLLFWTDG